METIPTLLFISIAGGHAWSTVNGVGNGFCGGAFRFRIKQGVSASRSGRGDGNSNRSLEEAQFSKNIAWRCE